jgi:hypothetical protein
MQRTLAQAVDPGFFVVLLISLLAVWPLLSRAGLSEGTDAELHIFRLHELSQLWSAAASSIPAGRPTSTTATATPSSITTRR